MVSLSNALKELTLVTRKYVAEGIPEVDTALENAGKALRFHSELCKTLFGEKFPANEGLNGRGPTYL